MESGLTDIELLVTRLDLEHQRLQLLEKKRALLHHHPGAELRAVELLIEKLRLEKMRETIQERRKFERNGPQRRGGFIRAL